MGPINEWWTAGFDGGEKALIGFSTGTVAVLYIVQYVNSVTYLLKLTSQFCPTLDFIRCR